MAIGMTPWAAREELAHGRTPCFSATIASARHITWPDPSAGSELTMTCDACAARIF